MVYNSGIMICPHCKIAVHESFTDWSGPATDSRCHWQCSKMICPECKKIIIKLNYGQWGNLLGRIVEPKNNSRMPVPKEVDEIFSKDYIESCNVLVDSPKASAALSRRCLQNIIREKAVLKVIDTSTGKIASQSVKHGDLSNEIQQVLDNGGLPTQISEAIDAVRNIGNFAAHPIKSTSTGEIVEVEANEAELNLSVIESLFDYYFVQPKKTRDKLAKLNIKLADTGKPSVKKPKN